MSPTARSLAYLRELGYAAEVVEKTIPHTFIKKDLFGGDLIGLKAGEPVLVVQCTSGSHHAARRTKLEAEGFVALWKGSGAMLEIWSWSKQGPRGKRKTWQLKREALGNETD
jgi:hypothetical protein